MAVKKGFDPVPPTLVIGEEVDRGSFGVVYLATLNKRSVAVKQFHKRLMIVVTPEENVPLKNFKTECERLKDLNHPNVVRYIGAYEDKKGPLLVMELMHESLEKYLKRNKGRLSPERVLEICFSVCEGIAYSFMCFHSIRLLVGSQCGIYIFSIVPNSAQIMHFHEFMWVSDTDRVNSRYTVLAIPLCMYL